MNGFPVLKNKFQCGILHVHVLDGCLFWRKDKLVEVIIYAYVGGILIVGDGKEVHDTHTGLQNSFSITVKEATNVVGCKLIPTENGYGIHEPDILKKVGE